LIAEWCSFSSLKHEEASHEVSRRVGSLNPDCEPNKPSY
jgi:hypothetical protein